jgi:hypothetical protein
MQLNEDQSIILKKLTNFILDPKDKSKFFLLTGLAGTGKTFLVTYLITLPEITNKKIAITGCTNKAVGVLESLFRKNLNYRKEQEKPTETEKDKDKDNYLNFLTIHKLLQIKRKIDSSGEEMFISTIDENNIKLKSKSIFYYDIIIIDEVSMLNRDMVLQLLRLQNKIKGKVIFLGDKAQLPPVRETESHIFELADTKIPHSSLSKIMRSGDQIVSLVNSIRTLIENPLHKVPFKKLATNNDDKEVSRIGLFRNEDEWIQKYLDINKHDTEQIILCYTNRRVDEINKKVRKVLFNIKNDQQEFVDGEKIIFSNCYHLAINNFKYDSSQLVKIMSSSVDNIKNRVFNIFDIINNKYPITILETKSSKLREKYNFPKLALKAHIIEKNNTKLDDHICQICYKNTLVKKNNGENKDNEENEEDNICIGKCLHHYCRDCFYSWELNLNNSNSTCPLCIFKIKDDKIVVYNMDTKEDDTEMSNLLNELRDINGEYKIWLIMLENKDLLYVIHNTIKDKYEKDLEFIKNKLRDINNYIAGNYKHKMKFWDKIVLELWEFYYYFYIDQFAQINYGNAITTHRSQGSTYKRVYVDLIDIIKCNDNKKEGFQCLYTAVTRAAENLEILAPFF